MTTETNNNAFLDAIANQPAIYPGMVGSCDCCIDAHNLSIDVDDYALVLWNERGRCHIAIKFKDSIDIGKHTGETLISLWDDDARQFCEDWGVSTPSEIERALIEHADETCAEWAPEVLTAYYNAKISRGDLHCGDDSFSWQACEYCGSGLAGNRHSAHSIDDNGEIYHWEICVDCLHFAANGDIPENWE